MNESLDPVSAAGDGADWSEGDDLRVESVHSLFVTLGKAFRAHQLYDENNPVRKRFVETLRREFEGLWNEMDKLVVSLDEDHIYLGGAEVYRSESRNDSLAFLFFKDGVRELTFLPGVESNELEQFLGVLQKARKLVPEGDDLLTVLWEEDLQFFKYQYVDLLAEGVVLPEAGGGTHFCIAHVEAQDGTTAGGGVDTARPQGFEDRVAGQFRRIDPGQPGALARRA